MSFYAGKNNGKSQCHITSGHHTLNQMRGAPFKDTVFHTDVKYTGYRTYEFTIGSSLPMLSHDLVRAGLDYFSGYYYNPKNTGFISDIANGYAFMFTDGSLSAGQNPKKINMGLNCWFDSPVLFSNGNFYTPNRGTDLPSSTSNKIFIEGPNYGTLTLIVFDFKYDGSIRYPFYPTTNDIRFRGSPNGTININGIDIVNQKFMKFGQLNTVDPYIDIDGQKLQLVNYRPGTGGISIDTKDGDTVVKRGSKVIINSKLGSSGLKIGTPIVKTFYNLSGNVNNRPFDYPLADTFVDGQVTIFSFEAKVNYIVGSNSNHRYDLTTRNNRLSSKNSEYKYTRVGYYAGQNSSNPSGRYFIEISTYRDANGKVFLRFYPTGSLTSGETVSLPNTKVVIITL